MGQTLRPTLVRAKNVDEFAKDREAVNNCREGYFNYLLNHDTALDVGVRLHSTTAYLVEAYCHSH